MTSVSALPIPRAAADVALAEVLRSVAHELDLIVELGERTQWALSPLLTQGSSSAMMGVQELDNLVQQAHGLGAFVAALARACPEDWSASAAEAASVLRLHSQKLRLSIPGGLDESATAPGVFELF